MTRFVTPVFRPQDDVGRSYPDAKLFFYEAGTTTPKATYTDINLKFPNEQPMTADGGGLFTDIWLESGNYKVELYGGDGALAWERDNVESSDETLIEVGVGTDRMYEKYNSGKLVNYVRFLSDPTNAVDNPVSTGGFSSDVRTISFLAPFASSDYFVSGSLDSVSFGNNPALSASYAGRKSDLIGVVFFTINSTLSIDSGVDITVTGKWK